ncbi:MAG: hypothetical protein QME49_01980 [bacterium]|nr:hypothetical protein [bacterium]
MRILAVFILLVLSVNDVHAEAENISAKWVGDKQKLLHNMTCDDVCPVWSPDGKIIAFERIGKGIGAFQGIYYFERGDYNIFPVSEAKKKKEGGFDPKKKGYYSLENMLEQDDFYAGYFSWAPNILDNGYPFVFTQSLDLYTGLISTTTKSVQKKHFVSMKNGNGEVAANMYACWGKNNDIVFLSGCTGKGDLYLLNAADKNKPKRLTDTNGLDTTPKYSPNGTKIAYSSVCGENTDMFCLDTVSQKSVSLTAWPTEEVNPAWSFDGKMIAFYVLEKDCCCLWVMNADGSDKKKVADRVLRHEKGCPAWLPDVFGYKIIYISEYGNNMYISDVSTLNKWKVVVNEQVMSDVSCNPCPINQLGKKDLMIAYSAQASNGRKRIFIKILSMR